MHNLNCVNENQKRNARVVFDFQGTYFAENLLMFNTLNKWLFVTIGLSLAACANTGTLTGGEKDTRPPQLDSTQTTPNLQTNFEKQTIELTFDEWIKLEDIINQIIVSPPIEPRPNISLKKKTVRIEFEPAVVFKENVTYTINFGSSIKDFTEGNIPEDLRFVFSTGDYIDSLTVTGIVKDVIKKEPVKDVLVMLYDNTADSVVRKERPFYFAKTDKEGQFRIRNVRADTFKVFALEDQNLNYRFDATNERIAFMDTLLFVNDSSRNELDLALFLEDSPLEIKSKNQKVYGVVKLTFNQKPEDLTFRYEPLLPTLLFEYEKDSLNIWYNLDTLTNWSLIINQDTLWSDTIALDTSGFSQFRKTAELQATSIVSNVITQHPILPFSVLFNHPIQNIDSANILLLKDTLRERVTPTLSIDTKKARRQLDIQHTWATDVLYEFTILPNGVTDIFALSNRDTITQQFVIKKLEDYGNIYLTINQLDSTKQYIVQLHEGENNLQYSFTLSDTVTWKYRFEAMRPSNYFLHVITDDNRNGKRDSGNYDLKRQSESIYIKKLDALRPNWDLEVEVSDEEIKNR